MTPQATPSTLADLLRRCADALDAGLPAPSSIRTATYQGPPLLFFAGLDKQRAWSTWVTRFGGLPSEGFVNDPFPGKHQPSRDWTDGTVTLSYLEAMTEVAEHI